MPVSCQNHSFRTATIGMALLLSTLGAVAQDARQFVSPNNQLGGFFGFDVADAGDVDGDGVHDLFVGAENEFNAEGRAYVFSGASGLLIYELFPPSPEMSGYFGTAIDGLGDVDGDDRADVLVGVRSGLTPNGDQGGLALVFSGASGDFLYSVFSPNTESGSSFGASLSGLGDVDGDSVPDFVVGAAGENTSIGADAGRAYAFSGIDGALLHTLESPEATVGSGLFGTALSAIDDVDGDGRPDILVGTLESFAQEARVGKVYLFSGASGLFLTSFESPNPQTEGRFGTSVAGLSDVNGDSKPDVLIGAPGEAVEGGDGRAYVFDGVTGAMINSISHPTPQPNSFFGNSVASFDDGTFIASAPAATQNGTGSIGLVARFKTSDGSFVEEFASPNPQNGGGFGNAIAAVPYPNGSGVLVGAIGEDAGPGVGSGRAYLFPGSIVVGVPPLPEYQDFDLSVWPNPTNSGTTIGYTLGRSILARLSMRDALGRVICEWARNQSAGYHEYRIDSKGLAAGVYMIRLETSDFVKTQLVTVVR